VKNDSGTALVGDGADEEDEEDKEDEDREGDTAAEWSHDGVARGAGECMDFGEEEQESNFSTVSEVDEDSEDSE
jgi:hypothetical protein